MPDKNTIHKLNGLSTRAQSLADQTIHDQKFRKNLYDAAANGQKAYAHIKSNNMSLRSFSDKKTRKHLNAASDALHQAKARAKRKQNRKKKLLAVAAATIAFLGIGKLSRRHQQKQKNYGPLPIQG